MSGGNLFAYSAITTKIQGMFHKLLTHEQFVEIAHCSSVSEVFSYLQKLPTYDQIFENIDPSTIHRGQIEWLLNFATYEDFTKIYHFARNSQSKYMELYFIRYEIFTLKRYMRAMLDPRQSTNISIVENDFEKHANFNTKLVAESTTMEEFISNLQGTIYYEPLSKITDVIQSPSLFDYEMALDMFYFSSFWDKKEKYFRKIDREFVTRTYGSRIDLLNILWIYRCKAYYTVSNTSIYTFILPINYKLRKSDIKRLVEAENATEVVEIANTTYYGRKHPFTTDHALEEQCNAMIDKLILKEYKECPYSLASINAYFHKRNAESAKVITAIECIRYGYPPDKVLQYIERKGSSV